jgi:hypothetical protein
LDLPFSLGSGKFVYYEEIKRELNIILFEQVREQDDFITKEQTKTRGRRKMSR